MRRRSGQRGFVLLLVLVVLAIGGTLLAAAARRCGQDAVAAGAVQRDLQLTWGRRSCEAAVLPQAGLLLQERDRTRKEGEAADCELERSVTLGEICFHLVVGDENAKANVNLLDIDTTGLSPRQAQAAMQRSLAHLQQGSGRPLPMRLLPVKELLGDDPLLPIRYPSFDHVLVFSHPSELAGGPSGASPLVRRRITCWGSGRLVLGRADAAVLQEVLGRYLGLTQMSQLEAARRSRRFDPQAALAQLQLTQEQRDPIAFLTAGGSECYTLWTLAEGRSRVWYSLSIRHAVHGKDTRQWRFEW